MSNYPYKWSFNLSITPEVWISIIVWRGNRNWSWHTSNPLTIFRSDWEHMQRQ